MFIVTIVCATTGVSANLLTLLLCTPLHTKPAPVQQARLPHMRLTASPLIFGTPVAYPPLGSWQTLAAART
jgi:hypothetical protein